MKYLNYERELLELLQTLKVGPHVAAYLKSWKYFLFNPNPNPLQCM